ncbi:beta-lactamase class A [Sphingomonas sp. F9_3S_D5_B_2]
MTSFRRRLGFGLVMAAMAQVGASAAEQPAPAGPRLRPVAPKPHALVARAPAPAALRDSISALGRSFEGKAGIAVVSLREGWEAKWNVQTLFPQQSCSKLWVAITALDAVDRGRINLDQNVALGRDDLTLFHQPLGDRILAGTARTISLRDLMFTAITQSDNTANDKLLRSIGGPTAVRDMIARKGLGAVRFYNGERALQSKIAGLTWQPGYSIGRAFYDARTALPMSVRKAAFDRYLRDPYDGASPHAVANALAALKSGQLLSPQSTALLLSTMGQTKTGGMRVRAALAPGWEWNHKTGTGQELNGRIGGINDIGLLTAPDGSVYAVAIMTIPDHTDGSAQELMRNVAKTVIDYHESARGG